MLAPILALLLQAAPAVSQPQATDPLLAPSYAQVSMLAVSTWATTTDRQDFAGARLEAQLGLGHIGLALRADTTGLAGTFKAGKIETFRAIEVYLACGWHAVSPVPGLVLGPVAATGVGISLELQDGAKPLMPKRASAGLGLRVSWPKGWAYALVGQHQSLRGLAVIATWHLDITDHLAEIGTAACGAQACLATTGVAVRP